MGTSYNTNVVTDGLTDCWDAGNRRSWDGHDPFTADPFYDLAGDFTAYMINVGGASPALSFDPAHMGSITFDGTDDRIQVGSTGAGAGSIVVGWTEISVCVWAWVESNNECAKLVSTKHANSLDMGVCVQDDHSATDTNWFFCYINGDYLPTPTGSIIPHVGKWTHYVVTRNSAFTTRLYIDGELLAETPLGGAIGSADYNMCFGNREDNARPFEGKMASVYLYNRGLSAAEVKQNYEATKTRFEPRITKSGLVGNWDAGDPESYSGGSTWKDTANGVVGICYNDTSVANAAFSNNNGGYIEFDGTDDYVVVSDVSHLDLRDKLTMSCWAWFDGDGGGSNTIVFGKEKSGSAQYSMVRMNSGDTLDVGLHTGGWTDFFTSTVLSDDTWYHLSATYDRSNVKVYVNGSLVDTTAETDAISGDSQRFVIGGLDWQNNSTVPDHPMNGRVAIVRMYNKALSATEIMDNYNKTKARFGH